MSGLHELFNDDERYPQKPLVVQKFGGSSLADVDKIKRCAEHVIAAREAGCDVIVVVSAMGGTTDRLAGMIREIDPQPEARELSMLLAAGEQVSIALLATALGQRDVSAVSLTAAQAGILTTDSHTDARIIRVMPTRIFQELAQEQVIVVAGFQGLSYARQELTTLGRGGSDTTATALAANMHAAKCQIFSDVDGVYSADPRIVEHAVHLPRVEYGAMIEMGRLGAGVLNAEAIRWAQEFGVPVEAHAADDRPGFTVVDGDSEGSSSVLAVTGHDGMLAVDLPEEDEGTAELLDDLKTDIVHIERERGKLALWCPERLGPRLYQLSANLRSGADQLHVNPAGGSVSIVIGRADREAADGFAQTVERELSGSHITIDRLLVTDWSVTAFVPPDRVADGQRLLHAALVESQPRPMAV